MKKTVSCLIVLMIILSQSANVFAKEENLNVPYNWYCMHTKNGVVPESDAQMNFIEKYSGYYVDRNATDEEKVIYLTFDAGYENGNVEKIVNIMKEKNVTGAFFVLENIVKTNPELMKKIAENGNLICNHTSKHRDMTTVTDKNEFKEELENLEKTLIETTGLKMANFYRPPEGRFNEQNLIWAEELGYKTVFWSFAYADWDNNKQPTPSDAVKKIIESTHNGEIILLHPTSQTNSEIIGELIDIWKSQGYSFGSLEKLS